MTGRRWGWGAVRLAGTEDPCAVCGQQGEKSQGIRWLLEDADGVRRCVTCARLRWEASHPPTLVEIVDGRPRTSDNATTLGLDAPPAVIPGQLGLFGEAAT